MSRHGKVDIRKGSTVSAVAGTTLHLISHNWSNGVSVLDTPGLLPEIPSWPLTQRIRPVSYITEPGRAISIGEKVLAAPVSGGSILVSCFMPGDVPLALKKVEESRSAYMVASTASVLRAPTLITCCCQQRRFIDIKAGQLVDISLAGII